MSFSNRLTWETLRSIDSSTFSGSFQAVGTPLANASYICKMVNNSNQLVLVSIDGSTAVDVLPAGSFWLYDEGKAGQASQIPAIPKGTQFYVKGSSGTGLVYLVTQYIQPQPVSP
ncbi:hypothetical protein UFOVP80_34 [uncultured Caudovirales phage]|uniref:Uncharacterized protein n=1 Tax=uncultured Caudovirales phage TaxID=2100421 RepID=A0A6J5L003_9CAUD|nr:hypothetical protein UFOVP80_34 [uncultured Caudovirales phage]